VYQIFVRPVLEDGVHPEQVRAYNNLCATALGWGERGDNRAPSPTKMDEVSEELCNVP
jgi:hypothetical protein